MVAEFHRYENLVSHASTACPQECWVEYDGYKYGRHRWEFHLAREFPRLGGGGGDDERPFFFVHMFIWNKGPYYDGILGHLQELAAKSDASGNTASVLCPICVKQRVAIDIHSDFHARMVDEAGYANRYGGEALWCERCRAGEVEPRLVLCCRCHWNETVADPRRNDAVCDECRPHPTRLECQVKGWIDREVRRENGIAVSDDDDESDSSSDFSV